jgi:hypothetical protein
MLRSTERVKLIVITLTQIQEELTIIEELAVHFFLIVIDNFDKTALAVPGHTFRRGFFGL